MLRFWAPEADRRKIFIFSDVSPSSSGFHQGFTLIEVIVVMSLIAVMMFAAFPRLSVLVGSKEKDRAARWVIVQNSRLRTEAVSSRRSCALRVDFTANRLSTVVHRPDGNDEGGVEDDFAINAGDVFIPADELKITAVAFSDNKTVNLGTVDIVYYQGGYSDQAIIYMSAGESRFSFHIAPFLGRVRIYDGHVAFGQLGRRS